jgi:isopentenyl diphosphate isomerase/L-lactate dehydrogenase-like FMN-dependent dehydrogenase
MGNEWFEIVAVAQRRARKRLPKSVYGALVAGSEKGVTARDNVEAFSELGFAPRVAELPTYREISTTVMGQEISLPVVISPTGVQAVHPDGELAVARAAANRGTAMGLSSFASKPIEDVVAANPKTFFQMYWVGDRDAMAARMERARKAGTAALIATLDWSFAFGRDWEAHYPGADDPPGDDPDGAGGAVQPALAVRVRQDRPVPGPHRAEPGRAREVLPTFFGAYGQWQGSAPPSWDDVAWLREQWGGKFMLKGVARIDDAKRAVDAGVTAISPSPTMAATTWMGRRPRSGCCRTSPARLATRSRYRWTAGSAAAVTWLRLSRSARVP